MRALVLSGGGSRGAFQVGAIRHLTALGYSWDLISGVSVGALNGSLMAQYEPENQVFGAKTLEKMWTDIAGNKSIYKNWWCNILGGLFYGGMYNTAPLRTLVNKNFDSERLSSSGVKLRLGAVSFETGKYRYITEKEPNIPSWVMASSAFPVAFPPVKIDGESWIDGGVRDVTPIKDVLAENPSHIDIVLTGAANDNVNREDPKKASNAINIAIRSANLMSNEVFIGDIAAIPSNWVPKITIYSPDSGFKLQDPLTFDPKEIKLAVQHGWEVVGRMYNDGHQSI